MTYHENSSGIPLRAVKHTKMTRVVINRTISFGDMNTSFSNQGTYLKKSIGRFGEPWDRFNIDMLPVLEIPLLS